MKVEPMMRYLFIIFFLLITLVLNGSNTAIAQARCDYQKSISQYNKIRSGQLLLNSLSSAEKKCVFQVYRIFSRSSPPKKSNECKEAWDTANSTAEDVVSTAKRLIRCVEGSDHSDDCYSEARRVRSSHSDYESAASEVQSYCN
jgi:hypothetical protein